MHPQLLDLLRDLVGLTAGGVVGLAFGTLQRAALLHNQRREQSGGLKNAWTLMPGSGARVFYLLLVLLVVQVLCPVLFAAGTQWWVSGGVGLGYGWVLLRQLLRQWKAARA